MLLTVTAEGGVDDHGSVILLEGTDEEGASRWFFADRRVALDLIEVVQVEGEIQAEVESWQLWGGPR